MYVRARGLARGREGSEWERSTILSDFRRELSLAGAKAYSSCLLGMVSRAYKCCQEESMGIEGG